MRPTGVPKRFVDEHGDDAYELEALPHEDLQQILRDAIDGVIDTDAFNHEVDCEKQDAAFLATKRKHFLNLLGEIEGLGE